MHKSSLRICVLLTGLLLAATAHAQIGAPRKGGLGFNSSDPAAPQEYTLAPVTVSGNHYLDEDLIVAVAGLTPGQKVRLPNDDGIAKALRNLWKQDMFADVSITVNSIVGNRVFLNIAVEERPRLSKYNFTGIKKGEATELKDKMALITGRVVTDAVKKDATVRISNFFVEKGFGQVKVTVQERADSSKPNSEILTFHVIKGSKTHINQINISGNDHVEAGKLVRTMHGTKEMARLTLHPGDDKSVYGTETRSFGKYLKNFGFLSVSKTLDAVNPYFRPKFFSSSKFNEQKYEEDKQSLLAYYNNLGYRDAQIEKDTTYPVTNGNINIDIKVKEGHRYYFGDMKWRGNTKYSDTLLTAILGIKKGDIYNQELLDSRIGRSNGPEGGNDVGSLYMDDGYLFFNVDPVETSVINDTINYEFRLREGEQATIGNVNIYGNDRTNEHVIRRELRTLPGNKFSRADLIRSQREIANLGFFDPEKIGINPKPHPENGTVDIDYTVAEKSSDQLQLSAGFGGGVKFYGTIGIVFNNFSLRNIFKPKYWDPLPIGDGQKFSINYSSNGAYYNSLNVAFTEPWLGGKRPNALTTNLVYSKYATALATDVTPGSSIRVAGGGISLSKRLKWPDDNFVFTMGLNYQNYQLNNYELVQDNSTGSSFTNGNANNFYTKLVLARYTVNQPLYPTNGSDISLTLQLTPPFSAFNNKDYTNEDAASKYKWVEYHKYRFKADWYQRIAGNLVLKLSTKMGFMGYYNHTIGYSPFERFQLGGDGLSGYSYFVGKDIISQRGYETYQENAVIFNKYTAEARYPFSLSPTSTIYGLVFMDAANGWNTFKDYNPFKLNRDAGVGIRIYLPMFGLLGLDYGVGFDRYSPSTGVTSFKDISKFTFMLGFEPD